MSRIVKTLALAGALAVAASPVFAEEVMDTQVGKFDLDPFNILHPAAPPAPAAAPAPAPKKHHHHHHHAM